MRPAQYLAAATALLLPFTFTGCLVSHRKLPVPIAPAVVQTASPSDLVTSLNKHWDTLDTLRAKVEIQASVSNSKAGEAKDYTSIPGYVLFRKQKMVRVIGFVPVVRTRMFDMTSNGKDFTLFLPTRSMAYEGPNEVTKRSANVLENLRPDFFLDALVVRGIAPDDLYSVTADTDTTEDAKKKHLLLVPEYILSVLRSKPGSHELQPIRVVHFHRDDLLPYQQDLYDNNGNLETQAFYGKYVAFGQDKFPSTVTIKRPMEGLQVVLTVGDVSENVQLPDDQFQIQLPKETKIQTLR